MKLVQINSVCNGSTGKIMCDIALAAEKKGIETHCFFGRGKANTKVKSCKIENEISIYFHVLLARLGFNGYGSYFATKKLIKRLKTINPDVIHLHNIHGYYLNFKVLFNYLKREFEGKIVWTLHDCWTFTGHCAYFSMTNCKKWKKECRNCPQLNAYPKTYFDTTKKEHKLKKKLFAGLKNLTLVTPSQWLADLVECSFLKEYSVKVINNGINSDVFKPNIDTKIYKKYNIPKDKKIVLGVASVWEERKGLKDFIELSKILDDDYRIVLVGIDKKIKELLPNSIISIERTENQNDLAKLYSLATAFLNPTYEDNYPTTNIESIACGTPIICYDTGGCSEQVEQFKAGIIIKKGDISSMSLAIKQLQELKLKKNKNISIDVMVNNYTKLYK